MSTNSKPNRLKHVGAEAILAQRIELLNEYDRHIKLSSDDPVPVQPGIGAEAIFRDWLARFLPKKFGVTKGYIITTDLNHDLPLEEWDIIIYDALEAPVLFVRETADDTDTGTKRGIPVEYVRGVIEVKASLNEKSSEKATEKLTKLHSFIKKDDNLDYPKYLKRPFICASVYFVTDVKTFESYKKALKNMIPLAQNLPWMGALVLRNNQKPGDPGVIELHASEQKIEWPEHYETSEIFQLTDGRYCVLSCLVWAINSFPFFIFGLINALNGRILQGVPSVYGLDFENVIGTRLFHNYYKVSEQSPERKKVSKVLKVKRK